MCPCQLLHIFPTYFNNFTNFVHLPDPPQTPPGTRPGPPRDPRRTLSDTPRTLSDWCSAFFLTGLDREGGPHRAPQRGYNPTFLIGIREPRSGRLDWTPFPHWAPWCPTIPVRKVGLDTTLEHMGLPNSDQKVGLDQTESW